MFVPRTDPTPTNPSATPSATLAPSAMTRSSTYNVVSFIIAGIATSIGLVIFYFLYWRKRPAHPTPQLCVSRSGVVRIVTGDACNTCDTPERRERYHRQRIIERVQRQFEEQDRCEAEQGVRRVETQDARGLPKYSRAPEAQVGPPSIERVLIQPPPPAYDQAAPRPPSEAYTR